MRSLFIAYVILSLSAVGVRADENTGDASSAQERIAKAHAYFSGDCFNKCWSFIDKAERSPEDTEDMLLLAQTSVWHWKQRADCKPENLSIGYWQVSRVYAISGNYELARLFGQKCAEISEKHELSPFLIGYAYEAQARAEIMRGELATGEHHLKRAEKELARVTDEGEKGFLAADIADLQKRLLKTKK